MFALTYGLTTDKNARQDWPQYDVPCIGLDFPMINYLKDTCSSLYVLCYTGGSPRHFAVKKRTRLLDFLLGNACVESSTVSVSCTPSR